MTISKELHPSFQHRQYLFCIRLFTLFRNAFYVYNGNGNLVFYSKQKSFKLKEDFRVYADKRQREELLVIKTQQIFDMSPKYEVYDVTRDEIVGALKRKGLKSIVKNEWIFLSPDEREIGTLTESSITRALLDRLFKLIPQTYVVLSTDGTKIAEIREHFNPFVLKYSMTIVEPVPLIDSRLLISAGILLLGIEGEHRYMFFLSS